MEIKKIEKKVEKTFYADNGNAFSVGSDIGFVLQETGDHYVGRIRKIKKKYIVIDDIEINRKDFRLKIFTKKFIFRRLSLKAVCMYRVIDHFCAGALHWHFLFIFCAYSLFLVILHIKYN